MKSNEQKLRQLKQKPHRPKSQVQLTVSADSALVFQDKYSPECFDPVLNQPLGSRDEGGFKQDWTLYPKVP